MKQVVKSLVVVGAMLAAGVASADMFFQPAIGVDFLNAWTPGKGLITNTNVNAKDAFRKSFPGATVYVGAKFNCFLGVELGGDFGSSKKRTVNGTVTNVAATSFTYTAKSRRTGYHADLVGFWPIACSCWELFGSVGVGSVKVKLSDQSVTSTPTSAAFNSQFPLSVKRKAVARLGVGANYMFTDMIGGRVKLGWEGTERLRLDYSGSVADSKSFKNSTTLAAGLFVRW